MMIVKTIRYSRMATHLQVGGATSKGLRPKAQGCCTRLPWDGGPRCVPTPTGLWPLWLKDDEPRKARHRVKFIGRPQPFQGWRHRDLTRPRQAPSPRVAEYSNPGLRDATPSVLSCYS